MSGAVRWALVPWANPIAYVTLGLVAMGAGILKQPMIAFIGALLPLVAAGMLLVGFALAVMLQIAACLSRGSRPSLVQVVVSVLCLAGLFGAVLFAVSPLLGLGGMQSESVPVDAWRVVIAMLLSACTAAGLASVALRTEEMGTVRWWLCLAYWFCFVPAAATVASHFSQMGWHGRN